MKKTLPLTPPPLSMLPLSMLTLLGVLHKTVDNYQGEESDVVVGSFVRSNDGGQMGFIGDPNRLNVAISRARYVYFPCQVRLTRTCKRGCPACR